VQHGLEHFNFPSSTRGLLPPALHIQSCWRRTRQNDQRNNFTQNMFYWDKRAGKPTSCACLELGCSVCRYKIIILATSPTVWKAVWKAGNGNYGSVIFPSLKPIGPKAPIRNFSVAREMSNIQSHDSLFLLKVRGMEFLLRRVQYQSNPAGLVKESSLLHTAIPHSFSHAFPLLVAQLWNRFHGHKLLAKQT
jgi:hypothetical protein